MSCTRLLVGHKQAEVSCYIPFPHSRSYTHAKRYLIAHPVREDVSHAVNKQKSTRTGN